MIRRLWLLTIKKQYRDSPIYGGKGVKLEEIVCQETPATQAVVTFSRVIELGELVRPCPNCACWWLQMEGDRVIRECHQASCPVWWDFPIVVNLDDAVSGA